MAIERIVDTSPQEEENEEQIIEISLRPQSFSEYVGQERLKTNLKLAIDASKKREEPLDHILLYGPPGLGKTTMATVIAREMNANIRVTAGPAIERAADLASILTSLVDGDIHGPSIPLMFGVQHAHPQIIEKDGKQVIVPFEKFGVKLVSMGFFADPSKALIWRGPMIASAFTPFANSTSI